MPSKARLSNLAGACCHGKTMFFGQNKYKYATNTILFSH